MPGLTLVGKPEFRCYARGRAETVDVVITTTASSADASERAPMAISAVLDRSGSMSGKKLELVKGTCKFMVRQMSPHDRLGLVAYDNTVSEIHRLSFMGSTASEGAGVQLDRLQAGSTTNLSGGLFKGLQQQKAFAVETGEAEPVRSLLLFTDGLANVGITNSDRLVDGLTKSIEGKPHIQVHTLGFGKDHDASLLQRLAEVGGGNYYFIETPEDIPQAFADALGGLASVIAQNVEVQVSRGGADIMVEKVFSGFAVADEGDGVKTVSFGDVYSEERKDIVVRLKIPKLDSAKEVDHLLTVKISYFDAVEGVMKTAENVVNVQRADVVPTQAPDTDVVDQRCRFEAIAALRQATEAADGGDLRRALKIVREGREDLAKNVDLSSEAQHAVTELEQTETFLISEEYESVGSKKMRAATHSYMKQRSAPRYWSSSQQNTVKCCMSSVLTDSNDIPSSNQTGRFQLQINPKKSGPPPVVLEYPSVGGPSGSAPVPQQTGQLDTPRSAWMRFVGRMSRSMRTMSLDSPSDTTPEDDENQQRRRRRLRFGSGTGSFFGRRGSYGGGGD
ncbi:hypothetical protein BSKO_04152 [Bryopsis sp. KO-2023]|nr:hypothetical protein BSKO_04152 [Bryopsis sp. KO-2023]